MGRFILNRVGGVGTESNHSVIINVFHQPYTMLKSLVRIATHFSRTRFVQQTLLLMAGRGGSKVLSFLAFVLIARALGPDLYGGFVFAFSFASLMMFIPNLGVDPLYAREVAAGRADARDLLGAVLILKSFGSIVFLSVYFAGLFLTTKSVPAREASFFVGSAFVVMSIAQTWATVLITSARGGLAGSLEVSQAGLFLLFIVLFMLPSPAPGLAALGFFLTQVAGAIAGLGAVWCIAGLPHMKQNLTTCLRALFKAIPLALLWLVSDLYLRVNTAMLFYLRGDIETGFFGASYRLVEGVYTAVIVVCATALPSLSHKWSHGPSQWKKEWSHVMVMLVAVISIPVIAFTLMPGLIVHFVYGSSFERAADSLQLLGPATFVLCIGYGYGIGLTSLGLERRQLMISLVALVFNMCSNLWLIPPLGGSGAAIATLISAVVYVTLSHFVLRTGFKCAISRVAEEP